MATAHPFVSVVTPVYNGAEYLRECIDSVLAQTFDFAEYLIIDNRSTDDTPRIAAEYARRDPRIRVLTNETFLTATQNWNHALRQIAAESTYTQILHADDLLLPAYLERTVALAEGHPDVGVVSTYVITGDSVTNDGVPFPRSIMPGREICRDLLLGGPYVFGSPSSSLLRTAVMRQRPAFYVDDMRHLVDRESYLWMLARSDFGFVHEVLSFTRRHDAAISARLHQRGDWHPESAWLLQRWGPVFLAEDELAQQTGKMLALYRSFLGRSLFSLPGPTFWAFHRAWLDKLGLPSSRAAIAGWAAREVGHLALLPLEVAARVLRRVRGQATATPAEPPGEPSPASGAGVDTAAVAQGSASEAREFGG